MSPNADWEAIDKLRAESMGRYDPRRLDLKLVEDDACQDRPVYEFQSPFPFLKPGSKGKLGIYPEKKRTDGGSIPTCLQMFIQPMSYWLRVPFVRHDFKYYIQGGKRKFKDLDPRYTKDYNDAPVSRLRCDWELFVDIIQSDVALTWRTLAITPSVWNVLTFAPRITWRITRAILVLFLLLAFGWAAWNDTEPDTESI